MRLKIRIPGKHRAFVLLYFVTMLTLLLDQADALPMGVWLRKIKYLYILIMAFACVKRGTIRKSSRTAFQVLGLLVLHTLLFGFVFTNPRVAEATREHVTQLLIYFCMVGVTYLYVSQNRIFRLFINVSCVVVGTQLLISGLLHPGEFVNPFWGIVQIFTATYRYKTTFGFVHAGFLANECYLMIVLSILFWELNKGKTGRGRWLVLGTLLLFDGVAILMLIAAAERAGLIAAALAAAFYLFFSKTDLLGKKKFRLWLPVLIALGLGILFGTGLWSYIWANSNRSLNISVNYPVFRQVGNLWTGMGYVGSDGFQKANSVFGITTSSLDLYYVYIFFTTGVIGCVIQGSALVLILVKLARRKKDNLGIALLGIYISMLFLAFWQPSLFTYRYQSCFFLLVIILAAMHEDCCLTGYTCVQGGRERNHGHGTSEAMAWQR